MITAIVSSVSPFDAAAWLILGGFEILFSRVRSVYSRTGTLSLSLVKKGSMRTHLTSIRHYRKMAISWTNQNPNCPSAAQSRNLFRGYLVGTFVPRGTAVVETIEWYWRVSHSKPELEEIAHERATEESVANSLLEPPRRWKDFSGSSIRILRNIFSIICFRPC